ncbi:MAG: hypothetical protein II706_00495, partial [Bacteroidaceae bacterium]|nr:hypothetical protein [Bacteroidaceae bacterium]
MNAILLNSPCNFTQIALQNYSIHFKCKQKNKKKCVSPFHFSVFSSFNPKIEAKWGSTLPNWESALTFTLTLLTDGQKQYPESGECLSIVMAFFYDAFTKGSPESGRPFSLENRYEHKKVGTPLFFQPLVEQVAQLLRFHGEIGDLNTILGTHNDSIYLTADAVHALCLALL